MKRLIITTAAAILICLGWPTFSNRASSIDTMPEFEEVLRAHGGRAAISSTHKYYAQAVRLTTTQSPSFFERRLDVWVDGAKFRRRISHPLGLRERDELFTGDRGYYSTPIQGVSKVALMDQDRLRAVRYSIETFGLLPLLRRCAEPGNQIVSEETYPGSLHRFVVRNSAGDWRVYVDRSYLIRSVEIGNQIIRFADYRSIRGLRLPYLQRLSVGERLVYELIFKTIDLNPGVPIGLFQTETLGRSGTQ